MSKTNVPEKIKLQLWGLAAGRCQDRGCNMPLHYDLVTKRQMNAGYIAHIIADRPDGPRGDILLSPKLAKDLSNLMLLCDEHHRLVDKEDKGHPPKLLQEMKREHEQRIEILTSIQPQHQSQVLLYGANIGQHGASPNYEDAADAMVKSYGHYPASRYAIEIGLKNSSLTDNCATYWQVEEANLIAQFLHKLGLLRQNSPQLRLSVFALAPQPLLIKLGTLLGDLDEVYVYQRFREPATWQWLEDAPPISYSLTNNEKVGKQVAWIFSLSATITQERVQAILGDQAPIWISTHPKPHNDFLRSRTHLTNFRQHLRTAFNQIKATHGQDATIHIFPAMPVSACIELGRTWMPKADLPLIIYDQNKHPLNGKPNDFQQAIKIA